GRSMTCRHPLTSAAVCSMVNLTSSSPNKVFGIDISSASLRKTSSRDAFLRSIRQLLSLTMMQWHSADPLSRLRLPEPAVAKAPRPCSAKSTPRQAPETQPFETKRAFMMPAFIRTLQLLRLLARPAPADRLEDVYQDRFA